MATRFGAYEILYELKSGGMGAVLLGRRRGPGAFEQLVAIKTIRPEYAHAAHVRAMFLDEAAILARLNHPGVATVHDFGEENGTLYMVMEYVAGIPFRELGELRPPPTVAARAIAEACRGVHAAHELRDLSGGLLGVVHRDISPDNLMLGYDGHVKVIDFGIALVKNRQSPVTEFGTVKGKPPYMSPEQIANEAVDRRSDVFSLGVVLHELLAHEPLFDGDSIYAIAIAVQQKEIRLPSVTADMRLPLGLDAVVMNALDRDLDRRTPTAAALAEALDQVIQAAGDETLEAWAERELAVVRDAHRAWLAGVVAGVETAPRPGRATAQLTQVAGVPTNLPPVATPPLPPEPALSTHLPAMAPDDAGDAPPRSSRAPLLIALALVLAVGVGIVALTRHGATPPPRDAASEVPRDAAPPRDAVVILVPVDAASDAPADASADAPAGRTVPRDAAVHRDAAAAAAAAPPIDAPPAARGTGYADITNPGGPYLNVVIDGKQAGVTPMFHRKLPAGPHTIELLAPDTGAVVVTRQIAIEDGATAKISP